MVVALLIGASKPVSSAIVDVSWPNCKTAPKQDFKTGIIGVTGGRNFHPNPCLAQETSWFGRYALYINTGYPGRQYGKKYKSFPRHCKLSDSPCLAYNYGFNAARYAVNYANLQNAHASLWWLDVELVNSWTFRTDVNSEFLKGAVAGIKQSGFFASVGFYSAKSQWDIITGGWHNSAPAWLATGETSPKPAIQACKNTAFTGGQIWLTQYTRKLDENFPCSTKFKESLTEPAVKLPANNR